MRLLYTYLIFLFLLFVLPCFCRAEENLSLGINVQNEYGLNENVLIEFNISSKQDLNAVALAEITPQDFSNDFTPYGQNIDLEAGGAFTFNYSFYASIPGTYKVSIIIIDGEGKILGANQTYFDAVNEISEEPEEIKLLINFCKYPDCFEETTIFTQSEKVFLNYDTNSEELNIDANLIYPDKTSYKIILPTSINPEQIGDYELQIIAYKEGSTPITLSKQFSVIEFNEEVFSPDTDSANPENTEELLEIQESENKNLTINVQAEEIDKVNETKNIQEKDQNNFFSKNKNGFLILGILILIIFILAGIPILKNTMTKIKSR
ncbi:MAG: hypothetical protein ACOYT4_04450 [Nanoarchaeota archaeon]